MRLHMVFTGGCAAAVFSVWALAHVLPESWSWLPGVLYAGILMCSGLGSLLIRKRRERTSLSAEAGSVEREIAQRAASETFGATIVAMAVFGLYLVLQDQFLHAFVLYLLIVSVIAAYWVRYAIIRDRLT